MSFSFGTPSSAPATGLTSGFSFGANKPATLGLGLASTTQSTGVFGTPTTSTTGFGATPAFGVAAPAFGAATTAFGATTAAPPFGATATSSFGATSAAPAFGATTPAFGATTSAPAFGAIATPAFGSTAPSFGATTTPSFGGGLGTGGLSFGAGTNTSTAGGLNFGTPAISTAAQGFGGLGGFSFGGSTVASTGFSLLGSTSTATTTNSFFGARLGTTSVTGTQPSTSATPSLGLGGIAPNASGAANTTTSGDGKNEPPKQTKLPNEISTTVDAFKEFVKKQKAMSSEIMRVSIKPLHQVALSAEALARSVGAASALVRRARRAAARLRARSAAAAAAADRAPPPRAGGELEAAPPQFVLQLAAELGAQLAALRERLAAADRLAQAPQRLLSQEELAQGVRRMHGAMMALATRLQAAHAQTARQLAAARRRHAADGELEAALGAAVRKRSRAVPADPRAALGNAQQLAGPTPFTYFGNTLSPFPSADVTGGWAPAAGAAPGAGPAAGPAAPRPAGKRGKQ